VSATTAELVGTGQPGTIYLLHFDRPFGHARHYLGWTRDLDARLAAHGKASGSALMRAVAAAGIGWRLAATWEGDRYRERQLKARGHTRKCPICRAEARGQHDLFTTAATAAGATS
jgi:predicted GIY-YIG superfamily endonuclease